MTGTGADAARTPAEQRLEELAGEAGPRVLAYLARRVDPREDAADVYQGVLTTTWRRIHRVPDDPDAALGWMLAVARRELANHRRAVARRLAATDRLRDELRAGAARAVPGAGVPSSGIDIHDALAALGADDREVVTLTYWDGLTSDQVAAAMDASPAAVRKRLERARQRLASALRSPDPRPAAALADSAARA